ncbi:hypothetical protein [Sphingomonas faeni]|uniref:hypothetical protein n=1 Tax=Sphingomonas faeni TaxID=185950 RepID=UPI003363A5CE
MTTRAPLVCGFASPRRRPYRDRPPGQLPRPRIIRRPSRIPRRHRRRQSRPEAGLGVPANATYHRSRVEREGRPTVNLEDAVPFSADAKLFYEKHGINASVSYQYQSKFVSSQCSYIDTLAIKRTPYHELAASISYDILPKITVYAQGSNLLDSATKRFST